MLSEFTKLGGGAPIDVQYLLLALVIGAVLAIIMQWHFRTFGSTLSNRDEFARVFPFILLTTTLIISVVKSSLALSLGLVGALSIVRFRTPVKEPEELAYLFLAIAIGLGLGASQFFPTIIASAAILGFMAILNLRNRKSRSKQIFLSLNWGGIGSEGGATVDQIVSVVSRFAPESDLRRYETQSDRISANFSLNVSDAQTLSDLVEGLRSSFPGIGVSFLDHRQSM